jgi:predicted AAA+ superfamily ATPase
MIERPKYVNKLIEYKDKDVIKVITGVRGCGKSTLFFMFRDYLISQGIDNSNIMTLNLEEPNNSFLTNDYQVFYNYISSLINQDTRYYLFLDEIQIVSNFQKALIGLYNKKNIDIYITGSNSMLLSGELSSLLLGRYIEIKMLLLSFLEFTSVYGTTDLVKKYNQYLDSSFPFLTQNNISGVLIYNYLDAIFSSVVLKDIIQRGKVSNPLILISLVDFLFDNVGNIVSINKIVSTLTSNQRKTSSSVIENYLYYLINSYLFYQVKRYDLKGKKILS